MRSFSSKWKQASWHKANLYLPFLETETCATLVSNYQTVENIS